MKNEVFNIRMINTTDDDYPLIMRGLPNKEKYTLLGINDAVFVPLFQVIDEIIGIKADIIKRNGVECCPTCMKPFTPQQKVGEWIKIEPYPLQMHEYKCSECGHETDDNTENYCSECGIKMDIEKNEEAKKYIRFDRFLSDEEIEAERQKLRRCNIE